MSQDLLGKLETGESHRFADWPLEDIPFVAIGVYTIWMGDSLLYAGMAGRGLDGAVKARAVDTRTKKGLYKRLESHATGRRSGDQFCIYICDRFVIPQLTKEQQSQLSEGKLSLDKMTRDFIRENLIFRFVVMEDSAKAFDLERTIRRGALDVSTPLLNPLKHRAGA